MSVPGVNPWFRSGVEVADPSRREGKGPYRSTWIEADDMEARVGLMSFDIGAQLNRYTRSLPPGHTIGVFAMASLESTRQ